jgi:sigma-E factor negative regulatory protein RseB
MRSGLMMTAVATVTVPGLVAVLGVVGHNHSSARAVVAAAGAALAGPFPVATARAGASGDVAAVRGSSGLPVTVYSRVTSPQQALGLLLLDEAATAGLATSYRGTEQTSQSGVDGSVNVVSQVWHQGGGETLVQTSGSPSSPAAEPATSSAGASGSPEGVFGVTTSLVALLSQHYVAAYDGSGTVAGRTTAVVELFRFDGSLAARYWLDQQTMLPLRRELFDTSDNVVSEDAFVSVQFGSLSASKTAVAGAAEQQSQAQSPSAWVTATSPGQFRASLTGQGWRVPASLPGGLPLYAAAWTQTSDGKVADLEYSDGLYVVSLFVQQGALAASMPGWRPVTLASTQAFVSGHSVTWAGSGLVYTAIADAPPQTVTQVVGSLQDNGSSGLLSRLGRGFERLARMVNPFR